MLRSGFFCCWLVLLLLSNCSSPRIISYAHPTAAFDRYRTFRIEPHTEVQQLSPEGHKTFERLDNFIANQLKSRGYESSLDPDLRVAYEISTGLSQNTPNQYYDRYSYWYYPSYSYSVPPQDVEAMVEIKMIDTATKKTVWTGSADFTLKPRRDDNAERIEQQIIGIFDRFEFHAPD